MIHHLSVYKLFFIHKFVWYSIFFAFLLEHSFHAMFFFQNERVVASSFSFLGEWSSCPITYCCGVCFVMVVETFKQTDKGHQDTLKKIVDKAMHNMLSSCASITSCINTTACNGTMRARTNCHPYSHPHSYSSR